MAMSFKHFTTDNLGNIVDSPGADLTDILAGVKVGFDLGDERVIKSGDLRLKAYSTLPFDTTSTKQNWIGAYWNGTLKSVYLHADEWTYDESGKLYDYNLPSLHSQFFSDLKTQGLEFTIGPNLWNLALSQGACVLSEIRLNGDLVGFGQPNRYAFSLGNILGGLAGKSNANFYEIKTIIMPIATFTNNDIIVIHRGDSKPYTDSLQNAVDFTFKHDDNGNAYNLTWWNLFDLVRNSHNAFILIDPIIESSKLKVTIRVVTKNSLIYTSSVVRDWLADRQYIKGIYRVDGYKITGHNFEFKSSYYGGNYDIDREVGINDTNTYVSDIVLSLCWVRADYNNTTLGGYFVYNTMQSVMNSSYAGTFYANAVTGGDGYDGKYVYGGENLLDFVDAPTELFPGFGNLATINLYSITINENGIADVSGAIVSKPL